MIKELKKLFRLFGEDVLVVGRQSEMDSLASQGVPQGIWLAWEVLLIGKMDVGRLKNIHGIKKVFPGAVLSPTV